MHELYAILDAWRALGPGADAVLATVVHVQGSAYRRPGARMLIQPNGQRIGSISGGCLESDVSRKAWWFTEGGRTAVRVYDTSSDDDAVWEFGLGCNGVIQVLLERVDSPACQASLEFLEQCRQAGEPAVLATAVRGEQFTPGQRWCFRPGEETGPLAPYVEAAFRDRTSRFVRLPEGEVFVEHVAPPPRLVILGAGHDAIPVAVAAKSLGWYVTVADGRPAYATKARFPHADRVAILNASEPLEAIDIGHDSLVVMMTHNYPQDVRLLPSILAARPRYLGILGPKKRAERLFADAGLPLSLSDVHAPAGLDIGGESAESIALAIVAEIQAELAGRPGMKLRHRQAPIHQAVLEEGTAQSIAWEPEEVSCDVR